MEKTRNDSILLAVIVLLAIAAIMLLVSRPPSDQAKEENEVVCTQDAKLCPDGSYVGRIPPLCEFSPCPTTGIPDK